MIYVCSDDLGRSRCPANGRSSGFSFKLSSKLDEEKSNGKQSYRRLNALENSRFIVDKKCLTDLKSICCYGTERRLGNL